MNHLSETPLMMDISVAVLGAAGAGFIASALRVPLVLAYLAAGILLGPNLGFAVIKSSDSIDLISEIGLVLLMFILGLEIDIKKLLQAGRPVLANGIIQFIGCAALAGGLFYLLGYRNEKGSYDLTYLAMVASLSSTLIVVKILSERRELDSFTSRITLGILVIQDLWAIGFLAIQPNLGTLGPVVVVLSLLKAAGLVGFSLLLARYILPHAFKRIARQPELMLLTTLSWCLGVAGLAQMLDLSKEMGALIAGVTVASFPYHADMAAKVGSLRDFFITLFFVSLGMKIPMPDASMLILASVLVGFAIVSRLVTVGPVLYFMGYGNRASITPALNLTQLSEFSLVLVSLGLAHSHVAPHLLSATIIAVVVSFLLSSIILPNTYPIYRAINPHLRKLGIRDRGVATHSEVAVPSANPRIVILGFYRAASSLLEELQKRHGESIKQEMLVVDYNPDAHRVLKERGYRCKYTDISHLDALQHLQLDSSQTIICTVPDIHLKGTTNLRLLQNIRAIAPKARIIVTADSKRDGVLLYENGASYVFCPRIISSYHLADLLERLQSPEEERIKEGGLRFFSEWKEVLQ